MSRIFLSFLVWVSFSQAMGKEADPKTVYWLFFDFPLAVRLKEKPPGYLIEMHRLIIEKMPEYTHQVVEVPFLRIMEQMKKHQGVCSTMLLKNSEREKFIEFGTPIIKGYPAGLLALKNNEKLKKFMVKPRLLDLDALLKDKTMNVGIVSQRFYGDKINKSIGKHHGAGITERKGLNVDHELRTLLTLGRLDVYIGYPFEVEHNPNLVFYFVKDGLELLEPRISCEKTAFGKGIVRKTEELRSKYKLDAAFENIYSRYYPKAEQQEYLKLTQ
ncbi:hypothetical protein [Bdellovibrio sp. HCB-162]|uniref:hypothetical protein n=1 Tax=Bdellovibrio sp. HCB-162 TaxID=3394234 RepID=UPI0039BCA809